MGTTTKLFGFLYDCGISSTNLEIAKREFMSQKASAWIDGYMMAIRHVKKRREIHEKNVRSDAGEFLDYLSDLTHGKK
jgi:hypothetical protein